MPAPPSARARTRRGWGGVLRIVGIDRTRSNQLALQADSNLTNPTPLGLVQRVALLSLTVADTSFIY